MMYHIRYVFNHSVKYGNAVRVTKLHKLVSQYNSMTRFVIMNTIERKVHSMEGAHLFSIIVQMLIYGWKVLELWMTLSREHIYHWLTKWPTSTRGNFDLFVFVWNRRCRFVFKVWISFFIFQTLPIYVPTLLFDHYQSIYSLYHSNFTKLCTVSVI